MQLIPSNEGKTFGAEIPVRHYCSRLVCVIRNSIIVELCGRSEDSKDDFCDIVVSDCLFQLCITGDTIVVQ